VEHPPRDEREGPSLEWRRVCMTSSSERRGREAPCSTPAHPRERPHGMRRFPAPKGGGLGSVRGSSHGVEQGGTGVARPGPAARPCRLPAYLTAGAVPPLRPSAGEGGCAGPSEGGGGEAGGGGRGERRASVAYTAPAYPPYSWQAGSLPPSGAPCFCGGRGRPSAGEGGSAGPLGGRGR